jgi:hypothetical protein
MERNGPTIKYSKIKVIIWLKYFKYNLENSLFLQKVMILTIQGSKKISAVPSLTTWSLVNLFSEINKETDKQNTKT